MNTKHFIILCFLILCCPNIKGQNIKGLIISIEKNQIYIDLTKSQVKAGDKLDIYISGGYMTHPVTGRRIKKDDEVLGSLEVASTYSEYSIARPFNDQLIVKLKVGMPVLLIKNDVSHEESNQISFIKEKTKTESSPDLIPNKESSTDKVSVIVAPAEVNDVVNSGHFGGYVADILMEQLLMCDKVRLLDRSVLNAQISEIDLSGDIINSRTAIQRGNVIGARYIIQTTMQKPDVANIRTGIPLASIMGAIQGATQTNIGAAYASNAQIATLKAAVSISVRVVDLQTGEVVFMASSTGKSQGKSQLSLEYGALGGGELNGGAEGFKQTVTGKAIQQSFLRLGKDLNSFFNGTTDRKVMGSVVRGGMRQGETMYPKGYKLYLGTEKLDKDGVQIAFADNPDLFFQYKKAKANKTWAYIVSIIGTGVGLGVTALDLSSEGATAIGGGIMTISLASGIILGIRGRHQMKKVANQYNTLNQRTSYKANTQLSIVTNGNGLGLRLTF